MIPPRVAAFASRIGLTGLLIAVLVVALAIQTVRLEGFAVWPLEYTGAIDRAEKAKASAVACEVRHAVTRASVDKLEKSLAAIIMDGKARDKRQQEALQEQEGRSAALDSQIDRIRSQRPSASPAGQECKSPAAVLEAEGL